MSSGCFKKLRKITDVTNTPGPTPAPTSAPTTGAPTSAPTNASTNKSAGRRLLQDNATNETEAPTGAPTGAPTSAPTVAPTYGCDGDFCPEPGMTFVKNSTFGGEFKEHAIHIPNSYTPDKPLPLLLYFHQWKGDWKSCGSNCRHSMKHDFVTVAMSGFGGDESTHTTDKGDWNSWNAAGTNGQTLPANGALFHKPTCRLEDPKTPACPTTAPTAAPTGARTNGTDNSTDSSGRRQFDDGSEDCREPTPFKQAGYCYDDCLGGGSPGGCTNNCSWTTCKDSKAQVFEIWDWVEANFCIDLSMVWASGCHNGGMFLYDIAQDARFTDRLAGIAPISASPPVGFNKGTINPELHFLGFWGDRDYVVPITDTYRPSKFFRELHDDNATIRAKYDDYKWGDSWNYTENDEYEPEDFGYPPNMRGNRYHNMYDVGELWSHQANCTEHSPAMTGFCLPSHIQKLNCYAHYNCAGDKNHLDFYNKKHKPESGQAPYPTPTPTPEPTPWSNGPDPCQNWTRVSNRSGIFLSYNDSSGNSTNFTAMDKRCMPAPWEKWVEPYPIKQHIIECKYSFIHTCVGGYIREPLVAIMATNPKMGMLRPVDGLYQPGSEEYIKQRECGKNEYGKGIGGKGTGSYGAIQPPTPPVAPYQDDSGMWALIGTGIFLCVLMCCAAGTAKWASENPERAKWVADQLGISERKGPSITADERRAVTLKIKRPWELQPGNEHLNPTTEYYKPGMFSNCVASAPPPGL